jgi:poly(3-hydroxybutyrate) depolymerase
MKSHYRLQKVRFTFAIAATLLIGCADDRTGTSRDGGPITGQTTGGSTGASANGSSAGNSTGVDNGNSTGATNGGAAGTTGIANGSTTGSDNGDSTGTSNGSSTGSSGSSSTGDDQDASVPGPAMSPGCGKATFPASGMYSMDVGGSQRMFIIKLPAAYDASKPYKLVFAWHFRGGSASGIASGGFGGAYYGLESKAAGSTIFVAPDGLGDAANKGWPNSGGQDVAFAKAMIDKFNAEYCVDTARIFSVGFSYGAMMSNTVGSQMGDVFRAIAPISGSSVRGTGTGPMAAWIYHGGKDETLGIAGGEAARDFWIKNNHCTTPGPADANGCVQYQGCDAGYPVIWCYEAEGTHRPPSFSSTEIWKFFSQF